MNVCLTIANISRIGGEERMCSILANELANRGYNVTVVSQNNYWWQKPFFKIGRDVKLRSMKRTLCEWLLCRILIKYDYPTWKYKHILKRNRIQLVIDVDTERSLDTVKAVEETDIRTISWEHFCYKRFSEQETSVRILNCLRNKIDHLVVLTKADYRNFVEYGNIPVSKISQIYNPSPITESEYIPHSSKRVLSMGRLESQKGIDLLLKAWSIIENDVSDWTLEIVGDGSQKELLRLQSVSLGLKNVIFSPFTDNSKEKYLDASVFVFPSRYEGLGLSLLEALNMSLPVVAFDCPNGPDEIIVDGVNGYLVPLGNVELFADKLLDVIKNDSLRNSLSHNALRTVKQFSVESIIDEWEKLISLVVEGKNNLNS